MPVKAAMDELVGAGGRPRLPLVRASAATVAPSRRPWRWPSGHDASPSPSSGGLGEVGRNCTSLEIDGRLALIDCGLMFPEEGMLGVDLVLPDFSSVVERRAEPGVRDPHPRPRGPRRGPGLPAGDVAGPGLRDAADRRTGPRRGWRRRGCRPTCGRWPSTGVGAARAVPLHADPGVPLHSPGGRGRLRHPRGPGRAQRRLQARSDAHRRRAHRPARVRRPGAARGCGCCWPTAPTPRSRGSSPASRAWPARSTRLVVEMPGTGDRRLLRQPPAPGAADRGGGGRLPAATSPSWGDRCSATWPSAEALGAHRHPGRLGASPSRRCCTHPAHRPRSCAPGRRVSPSPPCR